MIATEERRGIEQFRRIVEEATGNLVNAQHRADSSYIRTPLLYPSGATVVVRVDGGPKHFLVSDFGMGSNEADMMGGSGVFFRHARGVAEAAGVGFDNQAFFVVNVTGSQLTGAIMAVANCSQEAVRLTAFRMVDRKMRDDVEQLYLQLVDLFTLQNVKKDAEVIGASNSKHHVSTLVTVEGRHSVFDYVSNHHNSIAHASMKFGDIARLERAPARIAVVRSKVEMGTFVNLLAQSANVVERTASNDTYRQLARVA